MGIRRQPWALLLAVSGIFALAGQMRAQQDDNPAVTKFISGMEEPAGLPRASALPPEELAVRMGQQIEDTELDCSHFVQWVFEQAGLPYGYAPSRTLYAGMPGFKRVRHPQRGDLIVWPGHVGIVVDPEEQTFVSSLRSGVKTASYTSRYWKRRGHPRFFRYSGKKQEMDQQNGSDAAGRSTWSAD